MDALLLCLGKKYLFETLKNICCLNWLVENSHMNRMNKCSTWGILLRHRNSPSARADGKIYTSTHGLHAPFKNIKVYLLHLKYLFQQKEKTYFLYSIVILVTCVRENIRKKKEVRKLFHRKISKIKPL